MARLVTDDLLAKDLGERGRLRVRCFSWNKTGQEVLDVIRRVAP